jgi:hypothetical protein
MGLLLVPPTNAHGQWDIQDSHTNASLRGIHSVGNGVAWASGTDGTVLRTTDGGIRWQTCTVSPGAEKLDFRGIQAFDRNTAIVMSSGTGDLSRLYKTTNGCRTWKLVLTNPDPDGFWDAVRFTPREKSGLLYGDPVKGKFTAFATHDSGETWTRSSDLPAAREGESLFAASNSSLLYQSGITLIVTGGPSGSRSIGRAGSDLPLAVSASAGAFSVAAASAVRLVVVGGDKKIPTSQREPRLSPRTADNTGLPPPPRPTATDPPWHTTPSTKPIAVGPNGTDISTDDGRTWRPLKPSSKDAPDGDRDWNALSLPFAVGPKGRIGKLNANAPR